MGSMELTQLWGKGFGNHQQSCREASHCEQGDWGGGVQEWSWVSLGLDTLNFRYPKDIELGMSSKYLDIWTCKSSIPEKTESHFTWLYPILALKVLHLGQPLCPDPTKKTGQFQLVWRLLLRSWLWQGLWWNLADALFLMTLSFRILQGANLLHGLCFTYFTKI